jgi:hypothetical protein
LALADAVLQSSRSDSNGPLFAKELSEEAQKAKQELEDALGRGILQRVPSGGKISGIAYQRASRTSFVVRCHGHARRKVGDRDSKRE